MSERPTIVTLCGSTRFRDAWIDTYHRESLAGNIVLTIACIGPNGCPGHSEAEKERLDVLHLHKVELADEVLVLNVGGYYGDSTRRELAHARALGKRVRWLEPDREQTDGR